MRRFVSFGAGALVLGLFGDAHRFRPAVCELLGRRLHAARRENAPTSDDVLVNNLDFSSPLTSRTSMAGTAGAEYLIGPGEWFEGRLASGSTRGHRLWCTLGFNQNANGSEIEQNLKLRVVPLTATFRFLPLGGGITVPFSRHGRRGRRASTGGPRIGSVRRQFTDRSIFDNTYIASGTATGPVILGGVRIPASRSGEIGGEIRYQSAVGTLPGDRRVLGFEINLGGFNYLFQLNIRF